MHLQAMASCWHSIQPPKLFHAGLLLNPNAWLEVGSWHWSPSHQVLRWPLTTGLFMIELAPQAGDVDAHVVGVLVLLRAQDATMNQ